MAKLKIIRCKLQKNAPTKVLSGAANTFEATINPASYSHKFGISYSGTGEGGGAKDGAIGKSGAVPKFAGAKPENLDFKIVLDGTGVVPAAKDTTVAKQIDQLRDIAYDYDGGAHEPNPVKILWGEGIKAFYGRLTSMSVAYKLFHPDGSALRAEVDLKFVESLTEFEESLEAGRESPDLTHMVRVREGDTLPLLCQQIYKDVGKYLEIARLNDLDSFRDLVPNTLLRFPPMR